MSDPRLYQRLLGPYASDQAKDDLDAEMAGETSETFSEDPTPWCSYGHRTQAECDCGPIAENE